ncbi:hypothetical protein [Streptomyces sp. NBC_01353]|uniref:hypothetical protein n=1 Tax=Streptomyces sp. NBC_01353 TaxID=2903835 RepID=UPI002E2F5DDA|nr:hypothetical protein [Streptomyces sp. NBC_01353]
MAVAARGWIAGAAAAALAVSLSGFAPTPARGAVPALTWEQECPLARERVSEPLGYEAVYDQFTDEARTCSVIHNTSPGVLWISVDPPNTTVFLNGSTTSLEPKGWFAEAGALAVGGASDTRVPILSDGHAVIQQRAPTDFTFWMADPRSQWKAEFAVQVSEFTFNKIPYATWLSARFNLQRNVQQCASAATALWERLSTTDRPAPMQDVIDQLATAAETVETCKPIHEAFDPPPAHRTPRAANAWDDLLNRVKAKGTAWAENVFEFAVRHPEAITRLPRV